jgi:hypothetical protein
MCGPPKNIYGHLFAGSSDVMREKMDASHGLAAEG